MVHLVAVACVLRVEATIKKVVNFLRKKVHPKRKIPATSMMWRVDFFQPAVSIKHGVCHVLRCVSAAGG